MVINAAYIHIPFCTHICHYCDFNKVFLKGQPVDEYLDALEKEIRAYVANRPGLPFKTIFIGGGTPTALNAEQLAKLCKTIQSLLPMDEGTEYTFEANPGDLNEEKLRIMKDAGVNRISLGVQTFQDHLLEKIGRTHKKEDVLQSIQNAKKIGFDNISIDLIYSLPTQTLDEFREDLKTAFSLDVQHYSAYSLIIEPKTVFYNLMRKGKLASPGEDVEAAMYEVLMSEMEKHGFYQYEISNFSKTGYESNHNLTYWNNDSYYGFGAGAHGYIEDVRYSNYGPLKKYIEPIEAGNLPIMEENKLALKEKMEEEMFLGLRKVSGVSIADFQKRFHVDPTEVFQTVIQNFIQAGLIEIVSSHIRLTKKGRMLGNEVFQAFLL